MIGRQFQIEQIERAVEAVSSLRKIVVQLPTGGGKTVEFALVAQRFISKVPKAVLILVHREELMYQAAKTIEAIAGVKPTLINSKAKRYASSRIYIGMVESVSNRLHLILSDLGLVIIDECHIANFNKMHNIFLDELIMGYTATPISSSKKDPLKNYYRAIVTGPQISELIEQGFLCQNITRCPKEIVDATKLEIDKLKGDYNEAKMAAEYKKPKHVTNVVENYYKICRGQKTIVFNVNIEHSKTVTDCFVQCGYNAKHLDATSPDRAEILKWFKETEDAILCNVMIATVGFDEPTILNVINNFSTLSLPKHLQTCGRGGRIIDDEFIKKYQKDYPYELKTKTHFNIIDMGGNAIKFGDWNDNRDWKYIFKHPEEPGEGVAPVKVCPVCDGLNHASARVCMMMKEDRTFCMYEFEKNKTEEEKASGELILITKNIDINNLIQKTKNKHEYYPMYEMGERVAISLFEKFPNPSETLLNEAFKSYYDLCIEWWKQSMAGKGYIEDISNSAFHIKKARNHFANLIKKRQISIDF